jgi:predicted unusual protein kinase regulating ubiquinone biosynthesis (AarF/ABC1/UbiB family)
MIDDSNKRLRDENSPQAAVGEDQFIGKMEALTIKASGKGYFMEHLGTYISHICDVAAEHHVMMNPAFITAALAVKVQEGIALALDPGKPSTKEWNSGQRNHSRLAFPFSSSRRNMAGGDTDHSRI